jgi:hypothetical protein
VSGQATTGFGTVYRRADGRCEAQIRIPGGRRHSFYVQTCRDLIRKLAEAKWAFGGGVPVSAGATSLRTYPEYWLLVGRNRLRPTTELRVDQVVFHRKQGSASTRIHLDLAIDVQNVAVHG